MLFSDHALTRLVDYTSKGGQYFVDEEIHSVHLGIDARNCKHLLYYVPDEDQFLVLIVGTSTEAAEEGVVVTVIPIHKHQGLHANHRMVISPEAMQIAKENYAPPVDHAVSWGCPDSFTLVFPKIVDDGHPAYDLKINATETKKVKPASRVDGKVDPFKLHYNALESKRELIDSILKNNPGRQCVLVSGSKANKYKTKGRLLVTEPGAEPIIIKGELK